MPGKLDALKLTCDPAHLPSPTPRSGFTTPGTSAYFLDIASELRNGIYELLLLHEEAINFWGNYDQQLNSGLLSTSTVLYREASSLLYSQNRFDFSMRPSESIASFLRQIGTRNAGFIREVYIDFPDFHRLDVGDITINDDSVETIAQVRDYCPNVSTLVMSPHGTNAAELRLNALYHACITTEALKLIDTYVRAISSVKKIIVEGFADGPNDQIRREMERLGWTAQKTENVEEEDFDRSFSDLDDYSFDYDNDYLDDDDDYDIDNDSDFWRRAADWPKRQAIRDKE